MAHPKRKISKSRRDKRRTHYKAEVPTMTQESQSGETTLSHRAAVVKEGNKKVYYYNGRRFD